MKIKTSIKTTHLIEFSIDADFCSEEVEEYLYDHGYEEVKAGPSMEGFVVTVEIYDIDKIAKAKKDILKMLREFPKVRNRYFS
jgi:hypothetical protein